MSPSVLEPENGGYLVLFDSDLSIFCGGKQDGIDWMILCGQNNFVTFYRENS